jgi:hypothetical protein
MISSYIRLWFVGGQVDCIRKTSRPRTLSAISTLISPSLKVLTIACPRGRERWLQILCASSGEEFPVNIRILLLSAAFIERLDQGLVSFRVKFVSRSYVKSKKRRDARVISGGSIFSWRT